MSERRRSIDVFWWLETFPKIALAWGSVIFLGFVCIWLGIWLMWSVREHRVVLLPLAVPPTLRDRGFDGDVVARRVLDAMHNIVVAAHAPHNRNGLALPERLPQFRVPGLNVEYSDVLALAGRLGLTRRLPSIGGEIIWVGGPGSGMSLRLRFEHWPQTLPAATIDVLLGSGEPSLATSEVLDRLIYQTALQLMAVVSPITSFAYRYAKLASDSGTVASRADELRVDVSAFEESPGATKSDRSKAALLLGLLRAHIADTPEDQRRHEQRSDWDRALKHDSLNGAAHNNLGRLAEADNPDEALSRFRAAIAAEPKLFVAHLNLIRLHCRRQAFDAAIKARRQAERDLETAEAERLGGSSQYPCH